MTKTVLVPGLTYEDGEEDALDGWCPKPGGRAYLCGYLEHLESEIEILLRRWEVARDRLNRVRKKSATRAGERLTNLMSDIVRAG